MTEKQKNPWRTIGIAAAAVVLIYLAVQLYQVFFHPYKQETAILYELSDSVMIDGVVVLEETPVEGGGELGYLVEDGTRVVEGTQVAERYRTAQQAVWRQELTRLEHTISQLEKAQNTNSGSDVSVLSRQAQNALYDLLDTLDQPELKGLEETQGGYLLAENRVRICTGTDEDYTDTIEQLITQRDHIQGLLGSPEGVYSPAAGYFISQKNCVYLAAEPEQLAEWDPMQLREFLSGTPEVARGGAGKVVGSYRWSYYGVCDLATAAKFQRYAGKNVTISFPGKSEEKLPAKIQRVDVDEENAVARVVLVCEYTNSDMLKLVHRQAQISFQTYKGLRIDKRALHMSGEDKGVYIKYGSIQRFRKIYVLYENEDYILVPADQSEGSEVKMYDEVIVEGTDLSDGNLL